MNVNDGTLAEVVRGRGPAKFSTLAASLQNLRKL
jgi:hypothetical protein